MRYWLIKSEPDVYGIDDLARDKTTPWTGVRNYQARKSTLVACRFPFRQKNTADFTG